MIRVLLLVLGVVSCEARSNADTPRVEFGVLFGGDIQDRDRIPLELDTNVQELGLRLIFPAPLTQSARVRWEIEKPTSQRGPDGGVLHAAELGERTLRSGERRLDAKVRLRRGDPLGNWRVRVRVDQRVVHERAFEVVPSERD